MSAAASLELLDTMLADLPRAPALYQPTPFWQTASKAILADLRRYGMERFRSHPSASEYYVQYRSYPSRMGRLINSLLGLAPRRFADLRNVLQGWMDGSSSAFADYRMFVAADSDRPPRLAELSESDYGAPVEQYVFEGRRYGISFLGYLRTLAYLKKLVPTEQVETVLEIGGGFGSLGEVLLKCPDKPYFYVDVDIPPTAFVATHYLRQLFGAERVAGYDQTRTLEEIDLEALRRQYRAVVLCSWQLPRVVGNMDLFVNALSFQEMEPDVVKNYIAHAQRLVRRFVFLRNSVHGKPFTESAGAYSVVPVVKEDYLSALNEFEVVGTDRVVLGQTAAHGFVSEALVMRRKTPTQG